MINNYKPHVLILPEDDANRQIVNGFSNYFKLNQHALQQLEIAGGWLKVHSSLDEHLPKLRQYTARHLVLLIDFDGKPAARQAFFQSKITDDVRDRVYLLGSLNDPERLRKQTSKSFEMIGRQLATECADGTQQLWAHGMLQHNQPELNRLIKNVRPFLFPR